MIFSKLRNIFASIKSLIGQLPILIFSILSCCSSDENFPQASLSKSDALPKVVVTTTHLHDIKVAKGGQPFWTGQKELALYQKMTHWLMV